MGRGDRRRVYRGTATRYSFGHGVQTTVRFVDKLLLEHSLPGAFLLHGAVRLHRRLAGRYRDDARTSSASRRRR